MDFVGSQSSTAVTPAIQSKADAVTMSATSLFR